MLVKNFMRKIKLYKNFTLTLIFTVFLAVGFFGIYGTSLAYPPCNDPEGPICFGICKSDGCNPWPPPPEKLPDPFRLKAPEPLQFHEYFLNFYDDNLNIAHPWSQVGEMNTGTSGVSFNSLVNRLVDFGFYTDSAGVPLATSYNTKIVSVVADLQKALGFGQNASGVFTTATRDSFKAFVLDLLAANFNSGDNVVKFDIVWADGRVSLFNVAQRFSTPSTAFLNIPAPSTIPTFIRKDIDGKVYKWDRSTKKWNLVTTAFPISSTIVPTSVIPKGNFTSFASSLSTIGNQINGNFSTNRTVSTGFNNVTIVPSILKFLYRIGASSYNPISTATTFGSTSTDATKSFQASVGIVPTGIFDNNTAVAARTISDQINSAYNSPSLPANINNSFVVYPGNDSVFGFDIATSRFSKFINKIGIVAPPPGGTNQKQSCGEAPGGACWCVKATASWVNGEIVVTYVWTQGTANDCVL